MQLNISVRLWQKMIDWYLKSKTNNQPYTYPDWVKHKEEAIGG